ncbi:MAG: type II secretion system pseudopilin PulG [Methylophilales bacterium 16-45-7]|nr:MAG: type II secretion system pseudopilin PulG [Methylophilales bacterium 16-45-7]
MVTFYQPQASRGFTFIGILIIVALSGIALSTVGIVWHQTMQREKEKELLFIGEQYRLAISNYYESTPNGVKQYPRKLEDLLLDNRYPVVKRYLRRVYEDPMRAKQPWGLIKQQDFIVGVYSLSQQKTIKKTGFPALYESFGEATTYDEWKFIAVNN